MKKLEDMTLEELLELEEKKKVLTITEYIYSKTNIQSRLVSIIYRLTQEKFVDQTILLKNYDHYRINLPISKIINKLYNKILNDLLTEINTSSLEKDTLSICILIGDFLIPKGILSYTKKFHRTNSTELFSEVGNELFSPRQVCLLRGSYVVAGYGCCRHVNSFISDLINKKEEVDSEKIFCIQDSIKGFEKRKIDNNFSINHLIISYIENNEYHLIDGHNHHYSFKQSDDSFIATSKQTTRIVPDFSCHVAFDGPTIWNPNMTYHYFTESEVREKMTKINQALTSGEWERFKRFKESHMPLFEKIAYLAPLELERTEEKENQKQKRI